VLLYRVFPYLPTASPGEPGHPLYEHRPQRGGRIDHPDYFVWYLSPHAAAAIGETFGNLGVWDGSMFPFPLIAGSRRALGTYRLPDDLRLLDLDDPAALVERSLRPTQIVTRNLAVTQAWGHRLWDERDPHDASQHRWQAVKWWSYHRPVWSVMASWERPELQQVEDLDLNHPAVRDAAAALSRVLPAP
jgi:RES domain